MTATMSRFFRAAVIVPAALLIACSDDPVRIDDHPHGDEVEAARIHVSNAAGLDETIDVEPSATPPLIPVVAGNLTIRVEWLDHDGHAVGDLDHDFRLELKNLPSGITFTRTSEFEGTLTVVEPVGSQPSQVELFHVEEGHGDFEVSVVFAMVV